MDNRLAALSVVCTLVGVVSFISLYVMTQCEVHTGSVVCSAA